MTSQNSPYRSYHPPVPKRSYLRRKKIQFETTFCLYMLTTGEKIAFYSFFSVSLGLLAMTMWIYMPQHLRKVASRAEYYVSGEDPVVKEAEMIGLEEAVTTFLSAAVAAVGGGGVEGAATLGAGQGEVTALSLMEGYPGAP